MKLYHNTRCTKSREALHLLVTKGAEPQIVEYMKESLEHEELKDVLTMLGISAEELLRKKEPLFKEKFRDKTLSDDEWIDVMIQYPQLMERPILVSGNKAIIGRPPHRVLELV